MSLVSDAPKELENAIIEAVVSDEPVMGDTLGEIPPSRSSSASCSAVLEWCRRRWFRVQP